MDGKQLGIRSRASSVASTSSGTPSSFRPALHKDGCSTLADRYLTILDLAPGVLSLVGDGVLVSVRNDEDEQQRETDGEKENEGPLARTASDFSYSADRYAGIGWRIIGDAGGELGHLKHGKY